MLLLHTLASCGDCINVWFVINSLLRSDTTKFHLVEVHNAVILLADQVARCTKIIKPNTDEAKYVINVKQIAKVRRAAEFVLRPGSYGVLLLACRAPYVSPHNKG